MKKILIADDREENRYLLINFFKLFGPDSGIQIIEAASGKQALKLAKKEKPNLVIIDIKMETEIDGLETIRDIKKDSELSKTSIWVLTAQVMSETEKMMKENNEEASSMCDEFILKPFDHIELLNKAAKCLGIQIPKKVQEKLDRT